MSWLGNGAKAQTHESKAEPLKYLEAEAQFKKKTVKVETEALHKKSGLHEADPKPENRCSLIRIPKWEQKTNWFNKTKFC